MAQLLEATAREREITEKVAAVTTDNASNMVKAVVEVLQWEHIGCFTHTLQLAVKVGLALPAVAELLIHCRQMVAHFHRSTVAQNAFKHKQVEYKLPMW